MIKLVYIILKKLCCKCSTVALVLNVTLYFLRIPAVNEKMAAGTKGSVWIQDQLHPEKVLSVTRKAPGMAPATVATVYTD